MSVARRIGQAILERTGWRRVDLTHPAHAITIEILNDGIALSTRKVRGPGGLPAGTAGRLVALLSGGFDSPVAAWMMGTRGAAVDFVHLTPGYPDPEEPASAKAAKIVQRLSRFTGRSRLVLVPNTRFDLALARNRSGFAAILFRRFALRCGEAAAGPFGARGLVTGDSLSQVASQTLPNLISADAAVSAPVFRPLIGLGKTEIMERARQIGTWELSLLPAKDCCALIAGSPRTRSHPARVAREERRLLPDLPQILRASLQEALIGGYSFGALSEPFAPADERLIRTPLTRAPSQEPLARPEATT